MLWEIRHRFLVVCYEFKEAIARVQLKKQVINGLGWQDRQVSL